MTMNGAVLPILAMYIVAAEEQVCKFRGNYLIYSDVQLVPN
jgi:methylmalonyl-CoA mutase N-terminal domain/subunit